jgi:hypothetical protein
MPYCGARREMEADRKQRQKVSPKEYREFISGLRLTNIAMKTSRAQRIADKVDLTRKIDMSINDHADFRMAAEDQCIISHAYELAMSYTGEKDTLLDVSCTFEVALQTGRPMTREYFEVFSKVNLPVNTWPYFREFVHSMIGRMGLPPLILPMVKRG